MLLPLPTLHFLQIWAKLLAISNTRVCVPDVPTFQKLVQHRFILARMQFLACSKSVPEQHFHAT